MKAYLIIGVAGSGKTTVGLKLAERLHGEFLDADDYHPESNVRKMAAGIPLEDADRLPWLDNLVGAMMTRLDNPGSVVLACSALKASFRERFRKALPDIRIIYLKGSRDLIARRLSQREEHFFKEELLQSQFAALEEPCDGLTVSINQTPDRIVEEIVAQLG